MGFQLNLYPHRQSGGGSAQVVAERWQRRQHGGGVGRAAAAARQQRRQHGGSVGSAVAASAERRRQCGSEAATAGSAVTALAVQDGGGRDEDNGGDSNGGVHCRQSTKRGSGRDDSGSDGDGGGNSDSNGNGAVTARIRIATPMLKSFLDGTEDCFQRGSYDFLVSV